MSAESQRKIIERLSCLPCHRAQPVPLIFSRYLDTNGDGTGTKSAIGDYSVAAEEFFIQPPIGQVYRISHMIIAISDTSAVDANFYGNNITLTNGVTVIKRNDSGTIIDLTDGRAITTNSGWGRLCYEMDVLNFGNTPPEHVLVRWSFERSGVPLRLVGATNERLVVQLNDDFSGLLDHTFLVQGYDENVAT